MRHSDSYKRFHVGQGARLKHVLLVTPALEQIQRYNLAFEK
jgi:hypothetical protein